MKLFSWIRRAGSVSFGAKLMGSYFLLAMIPVIVTGFFAYRNSVESVREHTSDNIRGTLLQMRNNIDYKMDDVRRVANLLVSDQTLQQLLSTRHDSWSSYETTSRYLIPALRNALNSSANDIQLAVYLTNDTLPEMYDMIEDGVDPLSLPRNYQVLRVSRMADETWFRGDYFQTDLYEDAFLWTRTETDERFGNISAFRKIYDLKKLEKIGYVKITVKIDSLLSEVQHTKIGDASSLFVIDGAGRTIYTSSGSGGVSLAPSDLLHERASDPSRLVLREQIAGLDWTLAAVIPREVFARDAERVARFTLLIVAVNIPLILLLGMSVSRFFSVRIQKLVRSLQAFMDGDLSRRIHYTGNDEFARIAAAFNNMGENIEQLIRKNYEANLQKKETELAMLQSQINPHFLYNALSSISRLADFNETEKLKRMVHELSKFYRLALNRGKTIVSVRQELEHTRTYMEIQKIKFGDRVVFYMDIDESVYPYETVKIILQPFIENVLEHAWFGEQIAIRLTARLVDDSIEFKVIDNGVGMSLNTVDQLMNREGIRIGYGIRNCDERIRLHYGERYGVAIFSRPGIGTTATITIPARRVSVETSEANSPSRS